MEVIQYKSKQSFLKLQKNKLNCRFHALLSLPLDGLGKVKKHLHTTLYVFIGQYFNINSLILIVS
jgi:hypothetical protein